MNLASFAIGFLAGIASVLATCWAIGEWIARDERGPERGRR